MDLAEVLEAASLTDRGRLRPHNEDSVFASAGDGLFILADGMGGYQAGEVASGMATELLAAGLSGADCVDGDAVGSLLDEQVRAVNAAIYAAAQSHPEYAGMGTTLVMACFHDQVATVAHLGDSRLYRLRGGEFRQLTRDHSLLQEQLDNGMITPAQARYARNRNLVTRALGVDPVVEPEVRDYEVMPGDLYLFCSDGLNDMVEDDEIAAMLRAAADPAAAAAALVVAANENGGRDNVSVIVVRVGEGFSARQGWWRRLLARRK